MEEALEIWREVGDRRGESAVLMNIGNHLVDDGALEEGLRYYEQAIAGHRETGALLNEAIALANLGHGAGDPRPHRRRAHRVGSARSASSSTSATPTAS